MMTILARTVGFLGAIALFVVAAPFGLTADKPLANTAVVATMARAQIAVGDRLTAAGDFAAAREVYDVAAKLVRAQGKLPVEATRRIANAYYYEGDYDNAAASLDGLADEAAALGDPNAELWALADVAWLTGLTRSPQVAELRWLEVERLLNSADFPLELREVTRAKLVADLTVRAPHLAAW